METLLTERDWWALAGFALGALVLLYVRYAFRAGRIMGRYRMIHRPQNPRLFLAYAALGALIGLGAIGFSLYYLFVLAP